MYLNMDFNLARGLVNYDPSFLFTDNKLNTIRPGTAPTAPA